VPLTHFVQVRILVAQPKVDASGMLGELHLGFFGGSNMPRKLNGFLDFAQHAAMGVNVEVQKQEV
jgi:hypothetical protein